MKATIELTVPDEAEATVTLTATVNEWRKIRQQIDSIPDNNQYAWPIDSFRKAVIKAIEKATAVWAEKEETK